MSFFKRLFSRSEPSEQKEALDAGLARSKEGLLTRLARVFTGRRRVDEDFLEELEEALIGADVGVDTTTRICDRMRKRALVEAYMDEGELYGMLREEIAGLLEPSGSASGPYRLPEPPPGYPVVVMVVGVNGVGKTTSIAKLAHRFTAEGRQVLLGAADTFRAAAVDQLKIWAERVGVPVIAQQMGADPASVAFDTLQAALARKADTVIIDTAGRLHNKKGLMDELAKIRRVMDKVVPGAPHEVLLVLDGSTGQNALNQVEIFGKVAGVTGLVMTKLDGTARGGILVAIAAKHGLPVHFIGVGEGIDDLEPFDAGDFAKAIAGLER